MKTDLLRFKKWLLLGAISGMTVLTGCQKNEGAAKRNEQITNSLDEYSPQTSSKRKQAFETQKEEFSSLEQLIEDSIPEGIYPSIRQMDDKNYYLALVLFQYGENQTQYLGKLIYTPLVEDNVEGLPDFENAMDINGEKNIKEIYQTLPNLNTFIIYYFGDYSIDNDNILHYSKEELVQKTLYYLGVMLQQMESQKEELYPDLETAPQKIL